MQYLHLPIALAALAATACATANVHPTNWDTDGDGHLDPEEYRVCLDATGLFGQWDSDGGGALDPDEFGTGLTANGIDFAPAEAYEGWDRDGNGAIDPFEFYFGTFRELDVDGDGRLEPFEFNILGRGLGLEGGVEGVKVQVAQAPPRPEA